MSIDGESTGYIGGDVLEIMTEAVNYNGYLVRELLRRAGGRRNVVDFGAGIGTFATSVRDRGADVTCIESDEGERRLLVEKGFVCFGSLASVDTETADFVYTLNVLEHISDEAAVIREFHRVLKPGGGLYIYVPAFQLLYSSFDRRIGHFRRYRKAPMIATVEAAGFAVQAASYCDCLGFLAAAVYKMVAKGDGRVSRSAVAAFDRFVFPLSERLDPVFGRLFGKNLMVVAVK